MHYNRADDAPDPVRNRSPESPQQGQIREMSDTGPIEHPTWLRSGDFTEADEPLRLFAAWFEDAKKAEPNDPDAMALATVDADGLPNVRMVLLKGFDERGFVFYSNEGSQKGRELAANAKGRPCFPLEIAAPPGPPARHRGERERRGGRRLFREPPALLPDRRLGEQAVGSARKPPRLREGDRRSTRRSSPSGPCRARRSGSATG